ncbi:MAG: STAS domain-containing protein, partial [Candidatus Kryptoniota bacterium]
MAIKVSKLADGEIAVVEPKGQLIGGNETDELRSEIAKLSQEGNRKLVIDLGKTTYLNSTAIGVLIWAHTHYSKEGGEVKLANINKNIENIFVITKLTMVFDVHDSQLDAVAA